MQIHDDVFTAVRSPNPLEETMDRIAGVIKARLLNPGDRLPPERELAVKLGVSRSTLRVALQSLTEAGWLKVRRGRHGGSFVARWPQMPHPRHIPEILTEHCSGLPALLDYRRAIETATAGLAAERASAGDLAELEALAEATHGQERDSGAYRSADARFHTSIARAAYSPLLMNAVTQTQEAMSEVLDAIIYHSEAVLKHSTEYHWRIFAALRDRDADTARRLMRDHLTATENIIYSLIPESARCGELSWVQREWADEVEELRN